MNITRAAIAGLVLVAGLTSCRSEVTRADLDALDTRLDKIEARVPTEPYASSFSPDPIIIAKPQQNAVSVPIGAREPLCIRFRIADTTQEICHDTYIVSDSQVGTPGAAAIVAESKRKKDCYSRAKVGDRLPDCWQSN